MRIVIDDRQGEQEVISVGPGPDYTPFCRESFADELAQLAKGKKGVVLNAKQYDTAVKLLIDMPGVEKYYNARFSGKGNLVLKWVSENFPVRGTLVDKNGKQKEYFDEETQGKKQKPMSLEKAAEKLEMVPEEAFKGIDHISVSKNHGKAVLDFTMKPNSLVGFRTRAIALDKLCSLSATNLKKELTSLTVDVPDENRQALINGVVADITKIAAKIDVPETHVKAVQEAVAALNGRYNVTVAKKEKRKAQDIVSAKSFQAELIKSLERADRAKWSSNGQQIHIGSIAAVYDFERDKYVVGIPTYISTASAEKLVFRWKQVAAADQMLAKACKDEFEYKIVFGEGKPVIKLSTQFISMDVPFSADEKVTKAWTDDIIKTFREKINKRIEGNLQRVCELPFWGDGLAYAVARYVAANEKYLTANACTDMLIKGHTSFMGTLAETPFDGLFSFETRDSVLNMINAMVRSEIIQVKTVDGRYGEYDILKGTELLKAFVIAAKQQMKPSFSESANDFQLLAAVRQKKVTQYSEKTMLKHAMVLLEHPRVFELEPRGYVDYLQKCPGQLKSYVQTLSKLAGETYAKRIYRSIAGEL